MALLLVEHMVELEYMAGSMKMHILVHLRRRFGILFLACSLLGSRGCVLSRNIGE